jgi:hypothetical protein
LEKELKEKHEMELAKKEEEIACMRANREVETAQVQLLECELM